MWSCLIGRAANDAGSENRDYPRPALRAWRHGIAVEACERIADLRLRGALRQIDTQARVERGRAAA